MNHLITLISTALLIFLVACTSGGDDPASEPEISPTTPPLKEVSPEKSTTRPEPTLEQKPEDQEDGPQPEPTPEDDVSSDSEVVTSSAGPVQVDLSDLTSQPPEDTAPQEAPRPGIPDPKVAVAHQASQDLATRLGIDVGEVKTVSVEEVEWSDSSLGCPAPGMMYMTVITPGYLVILEAASEQYTYHTDLHRNFVLCGKDGQPVIP